LKHRITLLPGDGIGPEIINATTKLIDAAKVEIEWLPQITGVEALEKTGSPLPEETLNSIRETKIALKGPITTPIGSGFRSVNVALRKELSLYANLRPAKSIPGFSTRYSDIDLVVVRENTEDLYAGIEEQVDENTAKSIKLITRGASEKIAEFAFDYAEKNNRKKVTAVTKANIMKFTDGLFYEACRSVAEKHKDIEYDERLVDNMAMQLVLKPQDYDVLLMPNLYGDILSDLCAGLIGGLGVAPSGNYGDKGAVFEPVHGSAPTMAGKNIANPTANMLSACLMLDYIDEYEAADKIRNAIFKTISEGKNITYDLGGSAGTSEYTDEIIRNIGA
jgi:isocitrate dehydrogenase (NAD+)